MKETPTGESLTGPGTEVFTVFSKGEEMNEAHLTKED